MPAVTYYVALPFHPSDDGIAAGETVECFNPNAAVAKAEALSTKAWHCRRGGLQPQRGFGYRRIRRRNRDPQVRRRAGRLEHPVKGRAQKCCAESRKATIFRSATDSFE
jgi:hypothetical protein